MTFKYSYEECLACKNIGVHKKNKKHLILNCRRYGREMYVELLKEHKKDCKQYKPKREIKMENRLVDYAPEKLQTRNGCEVLAIYKHENSLCIKKFIAIIRNLDGIVTTSNIMENGRQYAENELPYDIVLKTEKVKITLYVYKSRTEDDILVTQLDQKESPNWELLDTITKEYKV